MCGIGIRKTVLGMVYLDSFKRVIEPISVWGRRLFPQKASRRSGPQKAFTVFFTIRAEIRRTRSFLLWFVEISFVPRSSATLKQAILRSNCNPSREPKTPGFHDETENLGPLQRSMTRSGTFRQAGMAFLVTYPFGQKRSGVTKYFDMAYNFAACPLLFGA